ncbi:MAG TPA: hypothetical protein VFO25_12060 [Candidatus Eremiobacteraceae bacterium]|nr:hypothetical protein [Candidatus Eremiobacteraceae bacterium]
MTRRALGLSATTGAIALIAICATLAGTCAAGNAASATSASSGETALAKFATVWDKLGSYTCSLSAHEVLGTRVQDRTYTFVFRKPYDTKMDITGGDGKGGAAVWHGGDTLRGHQGGFLSFVKLNLNIHDSRATSIRGTTIAQANYGAILDHVKSLKGTIEATPADNGTYIDFSVPDPSSDMNVTKERVVLASNGLPSEYEQWEGDTLVRRVDYTDVVIDPHISDSAFNL